MSGQVTIKGVDDDMFFGDNEALVIPVNANGGVHGAGLALYASKRWPKTMQAYSDQAKLYYGRDHFVPGGVWSFLGDGGKVRLILAATKDHWSDPSQLLWVEQCCTGIESVVHNFKVRSVAIPAIGSGLGGLSWEVVLPVLTARAKRIAELDCDVSIYPPKPQPTKRGGRGYNGRR